MGYIFNYMKSIIRHRKYVKKYCFMCHEYKRGLLHDLSKFSPAEFSELAAYYDGKNNPITVCVKANGYSEAWLKHKGRNDHHYDYWITDFDHGGQALRMPYHQTVEMLCDYLGERRDYDGKRFTYHKMAQFWENKTDPDNDMLMHVDTEQFMTTVITALANLEGKYQKYANDDKAMMSDGWAKKNILNEKILKKLYNAITEHNDDKIENIAEQMATL